MLSRIPDRPPIIKPIEETTSTPFWSVMIPAYNCFSFLQETLESVLMQDYGIDNMQIEVVDDCSTDGNIEDLVNRIGKGRISFFRQDTNLGSLRNFETCLNRSTGKWIHLLHGDDMVKDGFYKEIESLFQNNSTAGAAFTACKNIDKNGIEGEGFDIIQNFPGIIEDWLQKISRFQMLQPPSIVIKRSVYEQHGGYFGVHYGEDWEMYTRIAKHYPVAYSPKSLALYRAHDNNISSSSIISGQHIKDIQKVIDIIQNYLPANTRKLTREISEKHFSIFFAKTAHQIYNVHHKKKIALKQVHAALSLQANATTVALAFRLYIKCLFNLKRKLS
jgi:cellulose synthase/poly-beta-1,6-N-acetylglucosamine synthase-like glycosyltransferase